MDKSQAKFILQSFRPDGADAKDPNFVEALALAIEDRELGAWLTQERANDAAFTSALSEVPIPKDLRSAIFEMFDEQSPELNEFDSAFVLALAITPPAGLRDQILNAMEVEKKMIRPQVSAWKKWTRRVAITTTILAISTIGLFKFAGPNQMMGNSPAEFHQSAIEMLENPLFLLDLTDQRQDQLYNWLKGRHLPAPKQLPAGLAKLRGVGCKYLKLSGKKSKASLICYRLSEETIVHLVIMKKEVISHAEIPALAGAIDQCASCHKYGWATTQWTDEQHAFLLFAQIEPTQLAALF